MAVRSQSGQRWLTILIVSICSFFITFFIACLLLDVPELYFLGVLAFVLLVIGDWCLIGFSFLKLYQHLGRDVPLFIEAAMAQYSGQ